jgi:hypothetical protein
MITKETDFEKMEVFPDGRMRITEITNFVEDGKILATVATGRRVIEPGDDVEKEPQKIKDVAATVQTSEVVTKYQSDKQAKGL